MGDSDITAYLSVLAFLVVVGAIIAFAVALRVRRKTFRAAVGILLLAVAALSSILSMLATLLVASLGVAALVLASRTPQRASLETQCETED